MSMDYTREEASNKGIRGFNTITCNEECVKIREDLK